MKNNYIKKRRKTKLSKSKLIAMMTSEKEEDYEKIKKLVNSELKNEDIELIMDVSRELRLGQLFEALDIDEDTAVKIKKKVIKLNPQNSKCPLHSKLYKNHKGKYKVETLVNQYHDDTILEGIELGIDYGKKFIIEDIQNKRFSFEDIEKMSDDEIIDYCDEIREKI